MIDLQRLEEVALNSSQPPQQLLYDGWLIRLSPGSAKRARSVNAVYTGRLPLDEKMATCEQIYRTRGLPFIFRITPFSAAEILEKTLAQRGWLRFDETSVQAAPLAARLATPGNAATFSDLAEWIDAIGVYRRSPPLHQRAHLERLLAVPIVKQTAVVRIDGRPVSGGIALFEDPYAGLFDIHTADQYRGKGYARWVVAKLLDWAMNQGARWSYLQVKADNEGASALYRCFGFSEAYRYAYYARAGECA